MLNVSEDRIKYTTEGLAFTRGTDSSLTVTGER